MADKKDRFLYGTLFGSDLIRLGDSWIRLSHISAIDIKRDGDKLEGIEILFQGGGSWALWEVAKEDIESFYEFLERSTVMRSSDGS